MPIPTILSNRGSLVINPGGVTAGTLATNMRGTAWWVLDYMPLLELPEERTGNVVIPGANGRRAYPHWKDETTVQLQLLLTGDKDRSGSTSADSLSGLYLNIKDLRDNVCGPFDGTTTTRSATFTLPNTTALTASVQCRLHLGTLLRGADMRAVLDITIPAGQFV